MKQPVVQVVEAYRVSTQDVTPFEMVVGRLEPRRKTALHFEVEGVVNRIAARAGQIVDKDTLLMSLDEADYANRLAEAESTLQQEKSTASRDRELFALAENNVTLAAREVERLKNLGKKSLVSQSALDDALQRHAQLKSEKANLQYALNTAEQRLSLRQNQFEIAKRNLERSRLQAPYTGRVNTVLVEIGDRVTPGSKAIEFIDDSGFETRLYVSREAVTEMTEGMSVDVEVDGKTYQGSVIEFQRDPDPLTFTYEVNVEVVDRDLLSGSLARVSLPLKPSQGAVVVPLSAVLQDDGEVSVFVIRENRLEKRPVRTGIRYKDHQVIIAGLEPGIQVVKRDVSSLADGQVIKVQALKQ